MRLSEEIIQKRNLRASKVVHVYNSGDRHVYEMFNGHVYSFPPKSYAPVSSDRAWLWLGDPDLRENPTEWQEELTRLRVRVGEDQWNYRVAGNFYCKEFGDPKVLYTSYDADVTPTVVATPIGDLEALEGGLTQAPDPTILGVGGLDHLTNQVRTAPRRRQV
jgi:hypothetical protein